MARRYLSVRLGPDGQVLPAGSDGQSDRPMAGDPALTARIHAEIDRAGPITVARFMELALYDPDHGYYTTSASRGTRSGDFLTAPEVHPVFGWTIARQLIEMWERLERPDPFTVRELGAGSGALGVSIIDRLRRDGSGLAEAIRYRPTEVAGRLQPIIDRFASAGMADLLEDPHAPRSEEPMVGCVLANEFLDALPVHRVRLHDGVLQERYVTWTDDRLVEIDGPPSSEALGARLDEEGVRLRPGQTAEICLEIEPWIRDVSAGLSRGYVLVIDYGARAQELYGPRRHEGTLRAFRDHHVTDDPYASVGHQDLTAHVDLDAVKAAAERAGLVELGHTTQAEFLVGAGIGELLDELRAGPLAQDLHALRALRIATVRLIDPSALGGFAVLLFGKAIEPGPELRGLGFRLPARASRGS